MFDNSNILVTGGTGSFGKKFVSMTLKKFNPKRLIILSRDEMKQWEMKKIYSNNSNVMFFIGDVRDKDRLYRAFDGVDYVVHAAATKIVPTAEYDPFECIKTNIDGAMNVINASLDNNVKKVIALSTDKACSPINLYGATKLCSDKMFVAGNSYAGKRPTRFSVVRYGNVMGSRGSVIPFFLNISEHEKIPITDPKMTRFMIPLQDGVKLVWHAIEDCIGGEIYVKKIPSMNIMDIARALKPNLKTYNIGIRPGEKVHEQMISEDDAFNTYEYKDYYKIIPPTNTWDVHLNCIKGGKKVDAGFSYSSDNNSEWMTHKDLARWVELNMDDIGVI